MNKCSKYLYKNNLPITPRCVPARLMSSTKVVPNPSSERLEFEPLREELLLRGGALVQIQGDSINRSSFSEEKH